jgi:phosphonate transport system substrate-binding protein
MPPSPLRFLSLLAPNTLSAHAFLAREIGARLDHPVKLIVGSSYEQAATHLDVGFLCGLAYVELVEKGIHLEAIAAPVLAPSRYGGRPIYFSDVIVHRDSPFHSFADLRGRSWCFNEPSSHSGYGITRYHLLQLGETAGYFGQVIEAGYHERSLRLVCAGEVDASAIDSHVLAIALRDHPALAECLRIVGTLGPSTIQPVVVSGRLPAPLRRDIQAILLEVAAELPPGSPLQHCLIDRFVAIDDGGYEDIRRMRDACAAAGFLTLR